MGKVVILSGQGLLKDFLSGSGYLKVKLFGVPKELRILRWESDIFIVSKAWFSYKI